MPLVYSAISPHPPILIPNIGKANFQKVKKTSESIQNLANDLYAAKPDSLIIISPHAPIAKDTFLINLATQYKGDFKQFGDLETKMEFKPDPELVSHIKERMQKENISLNLINEPNLDHGTLVPLFWLLKNLANIPIIPLSFSLLPLEKHFQFGLTLQKEILISNKRVAVVASGDLSHCLTKNAPAPYQKEGEIFDTTLINLIQEKNIPGILNFDQKLIEKASECGLRSIIILLGILNEINYQPQKLSYEGPFGVGYLCMNFVIN